MKRSDLLAFSYYEENQPFSGSENGLRYRIEKFTEDKDYLKAYTWPEPFSFENTSDDKKTSALFDFSETGLCDAAHWINSQIK